MISAERVKRGVDPPEAIAPTRTLWSVQVLRALAALMVVIGHGQSAVAATVVQAGRSFDRLTAVPWGAGVDLFFVISGFIMVHASGQLFGRAGARREFLRRRLVRIVPLYWLVTTLFLALLAAATLKGGDAFPGGRAIIASYAFLPFDSYADGRLFPVFDLGWTLEYEMFFYAMLMLAVPLPRRRALTTVAILLVCLVAIGGMVSGPSAPWFWTRPILFDFGLGVLVGATAAEAVVLAPRVRMVVTIAATMFLVIDPARVFDGAAGATVANGWPRVVFAGVPIALLLACAVLGPEPAMPRIMLPLTRIGDASYSLYLFHPFALIATAKLAQKMPSVVILPGGVIVAATVATALVIAFFAHRWIERPITAALSRHLRPVLAVRAPSTV